VDHLVDRVMVTGRAHGSAKFGSRKGHLAHKTVFWHTFASWQNSHHRWRRRCVEFKEVPSADSGDRGWKSGPQSIFAAAIACVCCREITAARRLFGRDPAAMACRWVAEGAQCLHLVDLEGARDGRSVNRDAIEAIVRAVQVPCELGGGIRDQETIQQMLDLGLTRLVIGTKALKEPAWFSRHVPQVSGAAGGGHRCPGRLRGDGRLAGHQRGVRHRVGAGDFARTGGRRSSTRISHGMGC